MKRTEHMLIGATIGAVKYLLITGMSYLSVKVNNGALVLGLCCLAIVAITLLNILYKTNRVSCVFLRFIFSVVSYLLLMLICAYSGLIIKLEEILVIGSYGQNLQGLGAVFLTVSSIVVNVFAIIIKCIVLCCRKQGGGV